MKLSFGAIFLMKAACAREELPHRSISNADCIQAQPGDSIKKEGPTNGTFFFLAEKGGLEPPRQFLDRPTPLAGAPRHQLEYFSRLVNGLRLYSLLETAVLNSFLFLCR